MFSLSKWELMWVLCFILFALCKWLTWFTARKELQGVAKSRLVSYFLGWPGMDIKAFCLEQNVASPSLKEWIFAALKTLFGVLMFWFVPKLLPAENFLLKGWSGMVGFIFLLHFGTFHLIALIWQSCGVKAQPIMQNPMKATSVSEFWGSRWNLGFRQLTFDFVYSPLRKRYSVVAALLASFFVSGLIHESVISVPAQAGYGLPLSYFIIQGFGIIAERSDLGQRLGLGQGTKGLLFTWIVTVTPILLLFHEPFVKEVFVPFMYACSAL